MNDFTFKGPLTAYCDPQMNNDTVQTLWERFSIGASTLSLKEGAPCSFLIGKGELPTLPEGKEYALSITEDGIAIRGKDFGGLMRGYFSLLMKIIYEEEGLRLCPIEEQSSYRIQNRMLHICIFPDQDFYFIQKLVRLAGICQYTHLVMEFWGMLRFDCMKELGWPHAFTKEQIKELIREARAFGMEPIPMFNHLGHATGCRLMNGKHVVLEQNPALQPYFTPDGWAWNIHFPKTKALLKAVRAELYELFDGCEYFHLGCDEAYYYTRNDEERKQLPAFLKELTAEVVKEGKRPMVWMDMMLEHGKYDQKWKIAASCAPDEVEIMQESLHPQTVMIDWQYHIYEAPAETLLSLKDNPRDAMGAPWYDPKNYLAYADTIADHDFFGIMMTTWHTLSTYMPSILGCAKACGAISHPWAITPSHSRTATNGLREETATLMRRISFEGNTYETSGWAKMEIET